MLRLGLKSLTLGSMVALTTATTVFAQVPIVQDWQLVKASNFNCGPHLRTYIVKPLDNRQGAGIRCVKLSGGKPRQLSPDWHGTAKVTGVVQPIVT
jgi:hypothetical protein